MNAPAIVSFLLPKNLRVIEAFVRRHPGTTVLSPGHLVTAAAQAGIAAAGGSLVALDSLLSAERQVALQQEVAVRQVQLVIALAEPEWTRRWLGSRVPAAGLADCLLAEAAIQLPHLLPGVAALQQAAAQYAIRLVVVNEDLTPASRVVVAWARQQRIPSLHLSHSLLLCEPYTIHGQVHADVTAVFGERALEGYKDVGVDPGRLRITGNPAWDDYPQLTLRRAAIRAGLVAEHGLSAQLPIVVFGTTWSANLTALGDEGLYGKTLRAFLVACKKLHDDGIAVQPVVKDRLTAESGPHRLQQLATEVGLPADFVRFVDSDATPWVLAADVLISVQSNLAVEAMLAGVPTINLLTELGMALGPCFAADSGVVEAEESELAEAVRALLGDAELRAQKLAAMGQVVAKHNAGADGSATAKVVALMEEMAVPEPVTVAPQEAAPPRHRGRASWQVLRSAVDFVRARYRPGPRSSRVSP